MQSKSKLTDEYAGYAITLMFTKGFQESDTKGLLGFSLERHYLTEDENYYICGYMNLLNIVLV